MRAATIIDAMQHWLFSGQRVRFEERKTEPEESLWTAGLDGLVFENAL
jgi:hypothetical protein